MPSPPAINATKTHCKRGHAFDEANTLVYRGMRNCRTCHREKSRAQSAARRVLAPPRRVPVPTAPGMKWCGACARLRDVDAFDGNRAKRDGLQSRCRECTRRNSKHWRAEHPEAEKRWSAAYRAKPEHRSDIARAVRAYEARPDQLPKVRARKILRAKVAAGEVVKPDRCAECGAVPGARLLHAHHADYAQPLAVEWLCNACHRRRHRAA